MKKRSGLLVIISLCFGIAAFFCLLTVDAPEAVLATLCIRIPDRSTVDLISAAALLCGLLATVIGIGLWAGIFLYPYRIQEQEAEVREQEEENQVQEAMEKL